MTIHNSAIRLAEFATDGQGPSRAPPNGWPIPIGALPRWVAAVLPGSGRDMRPLFLQTSAAPTPAHARIPGVALSVGLHVIALLGGIAIVHSAPERTPQPRTSLRYSPVSLAVPVSTQPERPSPAPLVVRKIEPPPKPHTPAPVDEPRRNIEPPPPPAAETATVQAELEPPSNIVTVPSLPRAPEPAVRVGAFETSPAARPRARETAAVMSAGFGDAAARGAVRALPTAVVASGGFDREVASPPPAPPAAAAPTGFGDSSIEILFKPKPRYTDEAEALGIQGTVVLEVEFTAANEVRVLRVIRKLGHGLDEAAIRAAEQIRFKPARRQGVDVDSRVTVQIEFHLS